MWCIQSALKKALSLAILVTISGCYTTTVKYPNICAGDEACLRNLNAQTLAQLGHVEAATALVCEDTRVADLLRYQCIRTDELN